MKEGDVVVEGLGARYGEEVLMGGVKIRAETDVKKGPEMEKLIAK